MRRGRRELGVTGVIVTAFGVDGRVLNEMPVGLHDRMPLCVSIPEGTRTLRLTGTRQQLPRYRIGLGPQRRVIARPIRRQWRWWRR